MPLDNVVLATLDVPDNPQLRARQAELTCPDGVELQPASTYEARDPSGFIVVTVDKLRMVVDVRIRSRWTDQIPPGAFPAALYNTYVTAVQRALAVELKHRPARPPSTPAPDHTYVDPTELSLEEWMARTRSRLNAIDDEYDAIRRRQQAPQDNVTEIRSPLGYVTMQMRNGGPIAINGNPQALDNPSDTVLSEDILQLFVRAGLGTAPAEVSRLARPAQPNSGTSSEADDEYFENLNMSGGMLE